MTDAMDKALAEAVEENTRSLSQPLKAPPMPPFEKVTEPVPLRRASLAEQMQQLERVEREMVNRLRREGLEARAAVERQITDAHAHFERQLSEETTRLERDRDETVRQAEDAYHTRLHELAGMLRRRS